MSPTPYPPPFTPPLSVPALVPGRGWSTRTIAIVGRSRAGDTRGEVGNPLRSPFLAELFVGVEDKGGSCPPSWMEALRGGAFVVLLVGRGGREQRSKGTRALRVSGVRIAETGSPVEGLACRVHCGIRFARGSGRKAGRMKQAGNCHGDVCGP